MLLFSENCIVCISLSFVDAKLSSWNGLVYFNALCLLLFDHFDRTRFEHTHKRQSSISLIKVHSVADDEFVRTLLGNTIRIDRYLPTSMITWNPT